MGGSGTAFSLIQPTVTMNYIIKESPDINIAGGGVFGPASSVGK